jgi:predicted nucleic acid-binding protein
MLQANADPGNVGGVIYDALLAAGALKSRSEKLFTWNLRHYAQLGSAINPRLQTP